MARTTYNELDYASAVARLSALETRILVAGELEKLLSASSAEEAAKSLGNLGWKVSDDYDEMFENELSSVFSLIESIGGGEFLKTQRVKYDYHNLKVLIKAELTCQNIDDLLVCFGSIKVSDMKSAVLNRDYRVLTDNMKNAISQAYDQYARVADAQLVDIIFDSALLEDMFEYAKNQPEIKILDLIKMQIDINNILTFMRVRKMGKSYGFIERVIADGGHISPDFFMNQLMVSKESESSIFGSTPYSKAFAHSSNLELELDNIFLENVKKARLGAFGLAPIAAYFWIKENEIRNVRIILTCKKAGIKAEEIRSILRG